jgi:hypothetical protein
MRGLMPVYLMDADLVPEGRCDIFSLKKTGA